MLTWLILLSAFAIDQYDHALSSSASNKWSGHPTFV